MHPQTRTLQQPTITIAVPADNGRTPGFRRVWDDFRDGFTVNGPEARWQYARIDSPAGPFIADDGRVAAGLTARGGLRVISHADPVTGRPMFRKAMEQGQAGPLDHLKWLAYAKHTASSGFPGFDAVEGQELRFEAVVGGRTFGTADHPFGAAVRNPYGDPRLACVAMVAVDFETSLVFDFVLTNTRLYAFYERSPVARTPDSPYAAFIYAAPVAARTAEQDHALAIAYDRAAGVVRWLLDGREVFRVDRLGGPIDRRHMLVDHGGVEERVTPRQFAPGMAMCSMLDGSGPDGFGLARLSDQTEFYFDPRCGEPAPARFVDDESRPRSRLFGQGAELRVQRYVVATCPTPESGV